MLLLKGEEEGGSVLLGGSVLAHKYGWHRTRACMQCLATVRRRVHTMHIAHSGQLNGGARGGGGTRGGTRRLI